MSVDPGVRRAGLDQLAELGGGAAAQVLGLVHDLHHVGAHARPSPRAGRRRRRPGRRRSRRRAAAGRRAGRSPFMISSRASRPASLWARSITTVAAPPPGSGSVQTFIRPGLFSAGANSRSPVGHLLGGEAQGQRRRGHGQGVLHVDPAQAGQGHRHVDHRHDRQRVLAVLEHGHPAVQHRGHPAPGVQHRPGRTASRGRRLNTQTWARVPSRMAKVRGSSAFSTQPPGRLGDLGDHRLDLGQLVQGVDAAQAQVVGADVGHHRHVVVGHPDAAAQDAAAGGLGHRQLHPGQREHLTGPARSGVVAGLDQLPVQVDPVGARPADRPAGPLRDVARSSARWSSCRWCR